MRIRQHIGNADEEKMLEEIREKLNRRTDEEKIASMESHEKYHDIMLAFPVLKEYGLI